MTMTLETAPAVASRCVCTKPAVQARSTSRTWVSAAAAAFAAGTNYDASLTRGQKRAVIARFQQQL